jgi:hypothetical protein
MSAFVNQEVWAGQRRFRKEYDISCKGRMSSVVGLTFSLEYSSLFCDNVDPQMSLR